MCVNPSHWPAGTPAPPTFWCPEVGSQLSPPMQLTHMPDTYLQKHPCVSHRHLLVSPCASIIRACAWQNRQLALGRKSLLPGARPLGPPLHLTPLLRSEVVWLFLHPPARGRCSHHVLRGAVPSELPLQKHTNSRSFSVSLVGRGSHSGSKLPGPLHSPAWAPSPVCEQTGQRALRTLVAEKQAGSRVPTALVWVGGAEGEGRLGSTYWESGTLLACSPADNSVGRRLQAQCERGDPPEALPRLSTAQTPEPVLRGVPGA